MKTNLTPASRLLFVLFTLAASLFAPTSPAASREGAGDARQDKSRQLVQEDAERDSASRRRRVALVIGNSKYQRVPALDNPSNDARDMADALRRLGFDVMSGEDLTEEQMKWHIHQFGQKLSGGGAVGLFYYAGHGVQVGGKNYMLPVEVSSLREGAIEFDAVDVNRVLAEMDAAGNQLNIIILDACRTNPFKRDWRSGAAEGLAPIDAPEGTLIAYATKPNDVARDGTGRNGLYTQELLREMFVPGLTIEEVFKRVRISVRRKTDKKQVPWEASSLVGDFRFLERADAAPGDAESRLWESVKNSGHEKDFRRYLAEYPSGTFSNLARQRLAAINNAAHAAAVEKSPAPAPAPVRARPSPGRLTLRDKTGDAFFIDYGVFGGEEAFTLYFNHLHGVGQFLKFRHGRLIITRTRVAFVPEDASRCAHGFNLLRSELKELKVASWGGIKNWGGEGRHILIKIDGRPNMNFSSICFSTPESADKKCRENVEVLNFFTKIVSDYDRALEEFQRLRSPE